MVLHLSHKIRDIISGLWQGVISLRNVENVPLYLFYTIGIWGSYFLHFYLTFHCFESTTGQGINCALVSFVVGSIAVIVPTPTVPGHGISP